MIRGLDKITFESQGLKILEEAERAKTPYNSRCKACSEAIPRKLSRHTQGYCLACGLEVHYNDARAAASEAIEISVERAQRNQQAFQCRPVHVREKMGPQIGG